VTVRPKTERDRRRLLADAKRVIGKRYGEFDLGLADIAENVGCSPRQVQRVFREIGGTDFRNYLLSVRMGQARQLLSREGGGLTVREAARRVGYREASGLRQQFVRYFGVNPSDVQAPPPDYDEFWQAAEERETEKMERPRGR
jgi:AraC-like DNA-binding protein